MHNTPLSSPGITLIGLGPGDPGSVTRAAWKVLEGCTEVYVRTRQHPVVTSLPANVQLRSFDYLYDREDTFEQVYERIIEEILMMGNRPQGVIYAVPGHPFIAEATGPEIARRARDKGIAVRVCEGLSFLEPVFTALGVDPFPHTVLMDGLELAATHIPSFPPSIPALIAQIHSRAIASEVKLTLMSHYPDDHPVILIHAAGTDSEEVEHLALYEIDRSQSIGLLSTLFLPPLSPTSSFEAFQEVIAHLRAPDGCPWDRQQTHKSLRPYLLEETYEVLAALDADNPDAIREEFGDLLLQIVLHAQIGAEYGEFTMVEILDSINTKIVRRHPHVFGELDIANAEGVLQIWERLKAQERAEHGDMEASILDGIPLALPALSQASEYLKRAARVGFDWPDIQSVIQKLEEELLEMHNAVGQSERVLEIGDVLFAIANLARWYDVDPESALREANMRFRRRFGYIETTARTHGNSIEKLSPGEMLALWQEAKNKKI